MPNFLGALQPLKPTGKMKDGKPELTACKRVCGMGECENQAEAKAKLKELFKREYPADAEYVDDEKYCLGGVFVFDCTPYELIEKAADDESAKLITQMYQDAVELSPLVR